MSLTRERETLRSEISAFCKKLVLSQRAVTLCESEATPKQEEFLHRVLAEEMESRERSRRSRLMSRAGFPVYKTLDGYDRHSVKLPTSLLWSDLTEGTFIQGRRNLVLYGPVGTGNYRKNLVMERNERILHYVKNCTLISFDNTSQ
jgi:DNA replication protein DnaC